MQVEKFNVRIVNAGDKYGRDFCLTNDGEPLVEFYDSRYPHTEFGQFVSRYFVSTLINHDRGLVLDGGIPAWSISASGMKQVVEFLRQQ